MSGALVGRILTLNGEGYFDGLSDGAYDALIAIAEKAGADRERPDTHAQVRWEWIQWAMRDRKKKMNASRRTANRGLAELKKLGVVSVVTPGCKPNGQSVQAPVYAVELLPAHEVARAQDEPGPNSAELLPNSAELLPNVGRALANRNGATSEKYSHDVHDVHDVTPLTAFGGSGGAKNLCLWLHDPPDPSCDKCDEVKARRNGAKH